MSIYNQNLNKQKFRPQFSFEAQQKKKNKPYLYKENNKMIG